MNINPILAIDGYKTSHIKFYEKGTEMVYSNFTPRSVKYLPKVEDTDDKIVCFGLQYFIKYFLIDTFNREFFQKPKDEVIKVFKRRMDLYLGKDSVGTSHIEALHNLGYLPISIKALPEGSIINARVPYLTIKNTHKDFFWLTNYLEDAISCLIWRSCTAATIARKYRLIGLKYAYETGVEPSLVDWLFHDFSLRGCSGFQDAMFIGSAFLTIFKGSDNISAIDFLEQYYGADAEKELIAGSVPASEHSCVCVSGKDKEFENYKKWITEIFPSGIVSLVSDTWDLWNVITNYLPKLKNEILARDGKVVIRPDSSPKTPLEIICGDIEARKDSPENKGVIQLLWEIFGGTINNYGYKVLDSHIGCIYGESIQPELAKKIYQALKDKGFASSNIFMGIGSMSFVLTTRDSAGWACKATAAIVNGELREIYKSPKTDSGMKKSAKGLIRVELVNGEYVYADCVTEELEKGGELKEVFRDGKLLIDHTLAEIRARINK